VTGERTYTCPACGAKSVDETHFRCGIARSGGLIGGRKATGDKKRRGDSAYYRDISRMRGKKSETASVGEG
jgi:hypothetical protein